LPLDLKDAGQYIVNFSLKVRSDHAVVPAFQIRLLVFVQIIEIQWSKSKHEESRRDCVRKVSAVVVHVAIVEEAPSVSGVSGGKREGWVLQQRLQLAINLRKRCSSFHVLPLDLEIPLSAMEFKSALGSCCCTGIPNPVSGIFVQIIEIQWSKSKHEESRRDCVRKVSAVVVHVAIVEEAPSVSGVSGGKREGWVLHQRLQLAINLRKRCSSFHVYSRSS
ncbi:hypothetical protein C0J52_27310, partial [Blattella germanica]